MILLRSEKPYVGRLISTVAVVLLSAPYLIPVRDQFRPVFVKHSLELIIPEVKERLEENELLDYAGKFDGTICGDDQYTARVLEACAPRLKVISKWGTGVDSIDTATCERLQIRLTRTPNAFTTPVADSVMGFILTFSRRQYWMDKDMKTGRWNKLPARSLSECILGVIGVGNIGKAVIRRAKAFGMQTLGNDIADIDHVFLTETGLEMTSLENLLSNSDFISLNCDLNPTSRHLINHKTFSLMKPEAILINTARGPIVDEKAMIVALQSSQIAGAALDVFEHEPLAVDSPLLRMDNVILNPHNSNSSPAAWARVHLKSIKNLVEGLGMVFDD